MAAKKKPAKKASRKPREWYLAIGHRGLLVNYSPQKAVDMGYAKWVLVREVLPRKKARKR